MKKHHKHALLGAALLAFSLLFFAFIAFTHVGYLISIPYRGFTRIQSRNNFIYIDSKDPLDIEQAFLMVEQAQDRLSQFWGAPENTARIIIARDEKKLARMGFNAGSVLGNTMSFTATSQYIVLSLNGRSVNAIAHELMHAEFSRRLNSGRFFASVYAPLWFDEGLALQNDFRSEYDETAWALITNDGETVPDFQKLADHDAFYVNDREALRYHYIASRHEVGQWLKQHGKTRLGLLIDGLRDGQPFDTLYY